MVTRIFLWINAKCSNAKNLSKTSETHFIQKHKHHLSHRKSSFCSNPDFRSTNLNSNRCSFARHCEDSLLLPEPKAAPFCVFAKFSATGPRQDPQMPVRQFYCPHCIAAAASGTQTEDFLRGTVWESPKGLLESLGQILDEIAVRRMGIQPCPLRSHRPFGDNPGASPCDVKDRLVGDAVAAKCLRASSAKGRRAFLLRWETDDRDRLKNFCVRPIIFNFGSNEHKKKIPFAFASGFSNNAPYLN